MKADERDLMLTEIHGDVKVVKAGYEEHKGQIRGLFKAKDEHAERLAKVETIQKTCPAAAEARPATIANKLIVASIVVAVVIRHARTRRLPARTVAWRIDSICSSVKCGGGSIMAGATALTVIVGANSIASAFVIVTTPPLAIM